MQMKPIEVLEIKGSGHVCTGVEDLFVVEENGKYGILRNDTKAFLVPMEYDNIFSYFGLCFVLCKNGKIGICSIGTNSGATEFYIDTVSPCEYDFMERQSQTILVLYGHENGLRYYNAETKKLSDFYGMIQVLSNIPMCLLSEGITRGQTVISADDEQAHYIIDGQNDQIIKTEQHKREG